MGIEKELFVDKNVATIFECAVCSNVAEDPLVSKCCTSSYCKDCIMDTFPPGSKFTCNRCFTSICISSPEEFFMFLEPQLQNLYDKQSLTCPKLCETTITLGGMDQHVVTCGTFECLTCDFVGTIMQKPSHDCVRWLKKLNDEQKKTIDELKDKLADILNLFDKTKDDRDKLKNELDKRSKDCSCTSTKGKVHEIAASLKRGSEMNGGDFTDRQSETRTSVIQSDHTSHNGRRVLSSNLRPKVEIASEENCIDDQTDQFIRRPRRPLATLANPLQSVPNGQLEMITAPKSTVPASAKKLGVSDNGRPLSPLEFFPDLMFTPQTKANAELLNQVGKIIKEVDGGGCLNPSKRLQLVAKRLGVVLGGIWINVPIKDQNPADLDPEKYEFGTLCVYKLKDTEHVLYKKLIRAGSSTWGGSVVSSCTSI